MADDEKKVTEGTEGTDESEVVEGEVISEDSENSDKSEKSEMSDEASLEQVAGGGADEVLNLENMIKTNSSQIAKLSVELSEAREMLKDSFENDTTYREHADAAKEANKIKAATKAQILKQPAVAQIATNVKVLTSELKELKEALSDYLKEFNRLSGITEIEGDDGELMEIVYIAKLVKKGISRQR